MKDLCVVHLVRAQNGIEPFRRFLESYRANSGGIEHDLLIVFKGFGQPQDTVEYRALLTPFRYETLDISDEGFDITAYFAVVNRYSEQYRYFCFLNSYSEILDRDWLKKLRENISVLGVGIVGATGSWGCHRGGWALWLLPIIAIRQYQQHRENRSLKGVISKIAAIWQLSLFLMSFDRFPNYHVRTNAFMISGELIEKIKIPPIRTKMDAYKFESGRKSFTRQVYSMGKKVIVVGKNGEGYEKDSWRDSKTFWQSDQENLLVADNQTRDYQNGTPERRSFLSTFAWGTSSSAIDTD